MKTTEPEVVELDVASIAVFVSRARDKEKWEELKASMDDVGLKMPIQVRDISERPAKSRQRPEGGHYRYQLVFGEGRLAAAKELGWRKIRATITTVPEIEVVGRFLAENLIRDPLPWYEKGLLVAHELGRGMTIEDAATHFRITEKHVRKLQTVVSKTKGIAEDVAKLPLNVVEELATLPANHQGIVMEVLKETGERDIKAFVRKAKKLTAEDGALSKTALKASLGRVDEDLKRTREALKPLRLHHSLGPQNLASLLKDKTWRKEIIAAGANLERFEALVK